MHTAVCAPERDSVFCQVEVPRFAWGALSLRSSRAPFGQRAHVGLMRRRLRVGTHHASRRTGEGIVAIERVRFWPFLSTVTVPICILSSSRGHWALLVSQPVSYFTVPPRAHPSVRLSVRLRHSRSNTSTEYSLPGATQLPRCLHCQPLPVHIWRCSRCVMTVAGAERASDRALV